MRLLSSDRPIVELFTDRGPWTPLRIEVGGVVVFAIEEMTWHPNPAVSRILEACGLKGQLTTSLTIKIEVDQLIVTAAVICTTQEQLDAVADLIGEVKPKPIVTVVNLTPNIDGIACTTGVESTSHSWTKVSEKFKE